MRILASWLVALTVFVGAASSTAAAADLTTVEHVVFEVSISEFMNMRRQRAPQDLDWTSDGCSTQLPFGLGNTGRSFDFTKACTRHDFAYRNFARLGGLTEPVRARVDRQFLSDMRTDCSRRSWTQRHTCRAWAQTYYRAVRLFGGP
jgi:hypothetical protein